MFLSDGNIVQKTHPMRPRLVLVVCRAARQISTPKASQEFLEILSDIASQNWRLQIISYCSGSSGVQKFGCESSGVCNIMQPQGNENALNANSKMVP